MKCPYCMKKLIKSKVLLKRVEQGYYHALYNTYNRLLSEYGSDAANLQVHISLHCRKLGRYLSYGKMGIDIRCPECQHESSSLITNTDFVVHYTSTIGLTKEEHEIIGAMTR